MYCLATLLVALVATTTVAVSTDCTLTECINNTNYTGIEQSLFSRPENLVNLRQAFFPTNRQPSISVDVAYMFKNDTSSIYKNTVRYRWLDSPVNLIIRSDILFYLSLTIYKVDVRHVTITLDPIQGFENEKVNGTDLSYVCRPKDLPGHHLLNNLTVNVSTTAFIKIFINCSYNNHVYVYVYDIPSHVNEICT